MDPSEYLAFIPLLIYGLSIADLLSEWKRFINAKNFYFPYLLMTIIFIEVAIYNVFIYIKLVNDMQGKSYLSYLGCIFPTFIFLIMVKSFTPEDNDNTKTYFLKNRKIFFLLFSGFIASHFLYSFAENDVYLGASTGRMISIVVITIAGFVKKDWIIYILGIIWFFMLLSRINVIST